MLVNHFHSAVYQEGWRSHLDELNEITYGQRSFALKAALLTYPIHARLDEGALMQGLLSRGGHNVWWRVLLEYLHYPLMAMPTSWRPLEADPATGQGDGIARHLPSGGRPMQFAWKAWTGEWLVLETDNQNYRRAYRLAVPQTVCPHKPESRWEAEVLSPRDLPYQGVHPGFISKRDSLALLRSLQRVDVAITKGFMKQLADELLPNFPSF